MPLREIDVTIEEVRQLELDDILSECKEETCFEFERAFRKLADNQAGSLIRASCSMRLKSEDPRVPFVPLFTTTETRGVIASDFSEISLKALAEYSQEVSNPELKSRLCDLVWVTKSGSINHAYLAIDAYLESAKTLLSSERTNFYAFERIERALRLSCFFRKEKQRPDLFKKCFDYISEIIKDEEKEDEKNLTLTLLELCVDCSAGDDNWLIQKSEQLARVKFNKSDYTQSIRAWKNALDCAQSMRNRDKVIYIWEKISECHVKDSEKQSGLIAAGCLKHAIEALAKVPNKKDKRIELYELMRDHQVESLHELSPISTPCKDISKSIFRSIELSKGQDLFDSLFRVAAVISKPSSIEELRKETKDQMQNSISWIFGATHIDHEGMVLESIPGGIGLEDDEDGKRLWSLMMKNLDIFHQFDVKTQIKPAVNEFIGNYYITERALYDLFVNHPFIPDGHEYYFSKGIQAGFEGDFLTACHLLIPQIENSLRFILHQRGEEPSTLHGDGSQERKRPKKFT